MSQGTRKTDLKDNFTCRIRNTGDCIKSMTGEPACELCHKYMDCGYCAFKGMKPCQKCIIRELKDI